MKKNKLLAGLTILATATLLVACSNKTTTVDKSASEPKTEQKEKINDVDAFIEANSEKINLYRKQYYDQGQLLQYEKVQSDAEKKNEQVYLSYHDIDPKLTKLKVEVGNYNSSTKRLEVKVTNNYSEDLVGSESATEDFEATTKISLKGYYKNETGVKKPVTLMTFVTKKDIKSGESVTFNILMPYYQFSENPESKSYANEDLDSKYSLFPDNTEIVFEEGEEGQTGQGVFASYDNLFSSVRMTFDEFPKEAYVTDKELVEFYNLMDK